MVTYADLFQFCIFIVALGLSDFQGQKKIAATSDHVTALSN